MIRDSYLGTDKSTPAVESIKILFNGKGGYFPGVKRPGHEFDYSLPPCADVNNE